MYRVAEGILVVGYAAPACGAEHISYVVPSIRSFDPGRRQSIEWESSSSMQRDLEDQVWIVTGGSRGIGRTIVSAAAERGARVAFCARSLDPSDRSGASIDDLGRVLGVRADISREDQVNALFDTALDRFGRLDVLVNNAGIKVDGMLVSFPIEAFDEIMATNLTGAFLATRRAVGTFLAQKTAGTIISIGSVAQSGLSGSAAYAISKGGLAGLTHSIADTYGEAGIKSYLIVAGYVETDMTGSFGEEIQRAMIDMCSQKRSASPKEVAEVALFLASNRGSLRNGSEIYASGGAVDSPPYISTARTT